MDLINVLDSLSRSRVIPVLRSSSPALAEKAIYWLYKAGFRTFEITLTIPDALDLIRKLKSEKDILIGAGTVTSVKIAEQCILSGAKFIVTPCSVKDLPKIAHEEIIPCIMGAMTPSEVHNAFMMGADAVKIFPISNLGGVTFLKALLSIFPNIKFIPTGGIKPTNFDQYLMNGAMCVGIGGELLDEKLIIDNRSDEIIKLGEQILSQLALIEHKKFS